MLVFALRFALGLGLGEKSAMGWSSLRVRVMVRVMVKGKKGLGVILSQTMF